MATFLSKITKTGLIDLTSLQKQQVVVNTVYVKLFNNVNTIRK